LCILLRRSQFKGDVLNPEPNPTIVEAQGQGRVFYISGNITATLDGLRITDGNAMNLGGGLMGQNTGGGINIAGSNVVVTNCYVMTNTAYMGGGIYISDSYAMFVNNVIAHNTAQGNWSSGGGLYLYDSHAELENNTIAANTAGGSGGGGLIDGGGSQVTLTNNMIVSNSANWGGGLYVHGSSSDSRVVAVFEGNKILDNISSDLSGGLFAYKGDLIMSSL